MSPLVSERLVGQNLYKFCEFNGTVNLLIVALVESSSPSRKSLTDDLWIMYKEQKFFWLYLCNKKRYFRH